jgi:hypothetical protein
MKKPLSFWDARIYWSDGLVCGGLAALAMVGFAATSPLGRMLLASPWLNFADFLVYTLIGYWGHFVVTFACTLLLARARHWASLRNKKDI